MLGIESQPTTAPALTQSLHHFAALAMFVTVLLRFSIYRHAGRQRSRATLRHKGAPLDRIPTNACAFGGVNKPELSRSRLGVLFCASEHALGPQQRSSELHPACPLLSCAPRNSARHKAETAVKRGHARGERVHVDVSVVIGRMRGGHRGLLLLTR